MLSMSKISTSNGADYYLNLAREDYYLNGGEPPGRWFGESVEHFGLKEGDVVEAKTLKTIFAGYHPGTKEKLVQNPDAPKRTRAWDMTFSAPKSFSTLWSQTTSERRQQLQRIHDEAVKDALTYAQEVAGHTRRGKGGAEIDYAKLLFATFNHGTSRAQDPNLHTHAVLQNVAVRPDGSTGALHTEALYDHKMAIGAVYRLELARRVRHELGVHVEIEKDTFELSGVDRTLCDVFSTRAREIREEMKKRGVVGAKAAEGVTLETRHAKESAIPREQLFEKWEHTGRMMGWSRHEAEKVYNRDPFQQGMEVPLERLAEQVFEKLVDNNTIVSKRDLLTKLATRAVVHGASLDEVKKLVDKELSSNRVVVAGLVGTEIYYTRSDLLAAESSLAKLLKQARTTRHHVLSREVFRKVIRNNPNLSDEQKQALRIITRNKGSISCLTGIAGAGKSTTLKAVKEAYEASGYTVQCLAPTNQVARDLKENLNAQSSTIHSFLNRKKEQIVDQNGKTIRWKIDQESMDTIRQKLPSKTTLSLGFLQIEALPTRPLSGLHDGLFRKNRVAKWLGNTPWGHIQVSIPKRKGSGPVRPKDKPWRTLFSFAGVSLEVWKHPPCWRGIGPLSRIQVPYLKLRGEGKDPHHLDKKTLTIIDEAGMIDTKVMNDLVMSIAATGGKILFTGDGRHAQLQPVQAGSYFREVTALSPTMELTEIRRQRHEEDRALVKHLATGNAEAALANLIERDRYYQLPTKEDTAQHLINVWMEKCRDKPKDGLIIAATNEWNDKMNLAAQEARLKAGLLGPETLPVEGTHFRVGDRVLFTGKSSEIGVLKGDLGSITAIQGSRMDVTLNTGGEVKVTTATFKDVRLGYSITTHRSQGATVENVFIMAGTKWINKELTYVQVSRAREEIHLFCDDETAGPDCRNLIAKMGRTEVKGPVHHALQNAKERLIEKEAKRLEQRETPKSPPLDKKKKPVQRPKTPTSTPVAKTAVQQQKAPVHPLVPQPEISKDKKQREQPPQEEQRQAQQRVHVR